MHIAQLVKAQRLLITPILWKRAESVVYYVHTHHSVHGREHLPEILEHGTVDSETVERKHRFRTVAVNAVGDREALI